MSELIAIDRHTFNQISKALIEVSKYIKVNNSDPWIEEETAMELLGCKKRKLFALKESGDIRYKKVGKRNQYSRKSIEQYNEKHSS